MHRFQRIDDTIVGAIGIVDHERFKHQHGCVHPDAERTGPQVIAGNHIQVEIDHFAVGAVGGDRKPEGIAVHSKSFAFQREIGGNAVYHVHILVFCAQGGLYVLSCHVADVLQLDSQFDGLAGFADAVAIPVGDIGVAQNHMGRLVIDGDVGDIDGALVAQR